MEVKNLNHGEHGVHGAQSEFSVSVFSVPSVVQNSDLLHAFPFVR